MNLESASNLVLQKPRVSSRPIIITRYNTYTDITFYAHYVIIRPKFFALHPALNCIFVIRALKDLAYYFYFYSFNEMTSSSNLIT